ncbi:hypothetical protein EXIGLDRAFT_699844 [Exidia glandulosa HHB12029]|uniref:Uncharacterized protein n=1 Tax=Exidia glandulosa HHB12029 TaxID=1314781 RepID=A0A166B922_EXIGL|nr:hypothetical protein EXIGLDRAFT_699844 [Exidia glandulosa HHB12029]
MEALQTQIAAKDKKARWIIKDLQQALITVAKHSSPELFNEAKKATETQIGQLEREKDGLSKDSGLCSSLRLKHDSKLPSQTKQAALATNHAKTIASLQVKVAPLPRLQAAVEAWKTAVQACETGLKATIAQRDTVTKERDDALARIDDLKRNVSEARAELKTQRATTIALTKDRDDALERLESANARGEMLMGELAESQRSRRDTLRELSDATRQHDEAVSARDKALEERDEALIQRDAAVLHRDDAVRERDAMVSALDELKHSANARSDAAADLRRQVENLSRNNQASALALDEVRKDLEKAVTHCGTAVSECNELRAQCGRLVAQRDAVHTNYVALRREIQDHHCHFTSTHTLLNPVPITEWEATLRAVGEERDAALTLAKQQFDASMTLKADLLLALQRAENLKCERDELRSRISVLTRERDGRSSTAENSIELACMDGTRAAVRDLLDAIITGVGATEASNGHLAYMKTLHGDLLDALHDERKRNAVCPF